MTHNTGKDTFKVSFMARHRRWIALACTCGMVACSQPQGDTSVSPSERTSGVSRSALNANGGPPAYEAVFDVTKEPYRAVPSTNCNNGPFSEDGIQRAIEDARAVGGGIVYFPPGNFCIAKELRIYSNI